MAADGCSIDGCDLSYLHHPVAIHGPWDDCNHNHNHLIPHHITCLVQTLMQRKLIQGILMNNRSKCWMSHGKGSQNFDPQQSIFCEVGCRPVRPPKSSLEPSSEKPTFTGCNYSTLLAAHQQVIPIIFYFTGKSWPCPTSLEIVYTKILSSIIAFHHSHGHPPSFRKASCEKISKGIEACDQTALSWDIPYELLGIFIKTVEDCSLTRSFLC